MKLRQLAALLLSGLLTLAVVPAPAAAADFTFPTDPPTAQATLGEPIEFQTTFVGDTAPDRVEVLISAPGERAATVVSAVTSGSDGRWEATATLDGHVPPNTTFEFRFRIRDPQAGDILGPIGLATVVDRRFEWRTTDGPIVRLHWYQGDEAFGQRALDIGEAAIARASELLGVTETDPVDFFIYATTDDLYGALGLGTRENVGGQAHSSIRTMFGLIEPHEVNRSWVDTLVTHELTHLVFDTATENPYRAPPRWLNEGIAVYLSEGYTPAWRSTVEEAVRTDRLIPLDGLGGLFPTTANEFRLAYGESVSAINYFVDTYSEETLWALVRGYADGVSDDEAFTAATGADLAAFNEGWMTSLGADVPEPRGPQPAPAGPLPPDWNDGPEPTIDPGPTEPSVPGPTIRPTQAAGEPGVPAPAEDDAQQLLVVGLIGFALLLVALAVIAIMVRRRRSPPPEPPRWEPPPSSR
ncbi:hypothetical protein BH23CHL7_BH23CHL7_04920 [soil metagenome]